MASLSGRQNRYINRELSWLDFNFRVLYTAKRKDIPLLERLKFIAIAVSNLDEFYMVRIATRLREIQQLEKESGLLKSRVKSNEIMLQINKKLTGFIDSTISLFQKEILPALANEGVHFCKVESLNKQAQSSLSAYYEQELQPILTPIAIDPAHSLPRLRNLSINLALRIVPSSTFYKTRTKKSNHSSKQPAQELFALVQVPSLVSPFHLIQSGSQYSFIPLEDIISAHAFKLFPGHEILESEPFRITRASDLDLIDNESENLMTSMQDILRRRERGETVRIEIRSTMSQNLKDLLLEKVEISSEHIHEYPSLIINKELIGVTKLDRPELKFEPHSPTTISGLRLEHSLFRRIKEKDILLHHPYESFSHVVDFMEQASEDPDVVAIKQTFYRTSGDSPLVSSLRRAAANGKQVTALVELKARFDEANNIQWARELEQAGVHVVYGLVGLKTHAKLALVIRREGSQLNRYLHLGTGNYNPSTARSYTDLSLLTANEELTRDAMLLFNVLTGYADLPQMQHLLVAPFNLRAQLEEKIRRESRHAENGKQGHIILKINSLADYEIIDQLYEASQSGVQIDLIVRGICSLKPKLESLSKNIRVRSTIDRFLEHARVFWFANNDDHELYLSSADWMPRNLNRRIEIAWPILNPSLRLRILEQILQAEWADNVSSWELNETGKYERVRPSGKNENSRVQEQLIHRADQQNTHFTTAIKQELIAGHLSRLPGLSHS